MIAKVSRVIRPWQSCNADDEARTLPDMRSLPSFALLLLADVALAAPPRPVGTPSAGRSSAPLEAEIESEFVKSGLRAYEDLEYKRCTEQLERALAESLTRAEKVVTHRTLGFCHVAQEQGAAARADFEALLRIDPSAELDRTISPRVRDVFNEAKAAIAAAAAMSVAVDVSSAVVALNPEPPRSGEPVLLSLACPQKVASGQLSYRRVRQTAFSLIRAVPIANAGHAELRFAVPGDAVAAPGIEYYIVALDDANRELARRGDERHPIAIPVAERKRRRGGVVVGAVAGGVVGAAAVAGAIALGVLLRPVPVTLSPR